MSKFYYLALFLSLFTFAASSSYASTITFKSAKGNQLRVRVEVISQVKGEAVLEEFVHMLDHGGDEITAAMKALLYDLQEHSITVDKPITLILRFFSLVGSCERKIRIDGKTDIEAMPYRIFEIKITRVEAAHPEVTEVRQIVSCKLTEE